MVIKVYKCEDHGEFNHDCNMNDPQPVCPQCGKEVKRVFKSPHYSFKCDGFAGRGFA